MNKSFFKSLSLALAFLFCAATLAFAAQETKEGPVGKFFRRLFGWPAKTTESAAKTAAETTVEAGKTGAKTLEAAGKVITGKETPEKLVTAPVVGAAETGKAAVVGTAKTAETVVTQCPVVPEKK